MENERVSGVDQVRGTKSGMEYRTIDYDTLKKSYYRGEGNTTLVLALPDEGKVLRLRKSDTTNGDAEIVAGDENDNGEARVRLAVDFHRKLIAPLLGRFATEPEIVRCRWKDLKARLNELESERPASRCHKTVRETFATLLPDYAQLTVDPLEIVPSKLRGQNVCVEMKVKALTRHYGKPLHAESRCPSCYRTSGGVNCLRKVLPCLAHEAKSLKIFKDGRLLAQAGVSCTKTIGELWNDCNENSTPDSHRSMKDLTLAALQHPFPVPYPSAKDPRASSEGKRAPIAKSAIDVIALIEREFYREIDAIYPIYAKYSSILTDRMVYIWNENEETTPPGMPSLDELRRLRDYLIYRVVRDSSILVTYRSIEWREKDFTNAATFPIDKSLRQPDPAAYDVNITDLEPKNIHCIEKHYRKYIEKRAKSGC